MSLVHLLAFASALVSALLALGVFLRGRRVAADWAFLGGMAVLAVERTLAGIALWVERLADVTEWQEWRLLALAALPGPWLVFSLCFARGAGAKVIRRYRWVLGAGIVLPPLACAVLKPELITFILPGDSTATWTIELGQTGLALNFYVLVASVIILLNLERTFRASIGTIRWRIKFMLLGVGALFGVQIYACSQILLFHAIDVPLDATHSGAALVAAALIVRSLFRRGNAAADVYPSQSVLQGSLTVLLAGIYLLIVGLFAKLASYFGGNAGFALKTFLVLVAVVLLAILLQSERVRLRLRRFVSQNFHRPLYDYRTIWRRFNEGTGACRNSGDLSRTIVRITAELFQCLSVSVWLANEKRDGFALMGSTSIEESKFGETVPEAAEAQEVIAYFQQHDEPVDIETKEARWAAALRRWHASEFVSGGNRVCAPMLRQGDLVGLIIVGDRVGGTVFDLQDFEMLKGISDHATASLLNLQLSQRLLQAKELQAFQTMATFFVHDLKNAVSTLNLMLQNLPVHFDNPEFRQDALRGIGKTVAHMNHLIGRLGMLRHELRIELAATDFNDLVTRASAAWDAATTPRMTRELRPLPPVPVDREQITKVVSNLLLNATEAVGADGWVRIATEHAGDWVVLKVEDNGCGMSPDFMQKMLFRPFQTTKKSGLGIGMFQSKMIVEAHGGRIAVVSEAGKGTTFEVHLPVRA